MPDTIVTVADAAVRQDDSQSCYVVPPGDIRNVLGCLHRTCQFVSGYFQYRFTGTDAFLPVTRSANLIIAALSEKAGISRLFNS